MSIISPIGIVILLYFIFVPTLIGKIFQDKFFVFRSGFAPVYALGFFAFVGFLQISSLGTYLYKPSYFSSLIFFVVILLIPIGYIILNRKHLYRSEWIVGKATRRIIYVLLIFHFGVYFIAPNIIDYFSRSFWNFNYIEQQIEGVFRPLEKMHMLLAVITNYSPLERVESEVFYVAIPLIMAIANTIVYFVKSLTKKTRTLMYAYSIFFAIFFHYLGYALHGPMLIVLAAFMFSIMLSLDQLKYNRELISSLPIATLVYSAAFAFQSAAILVVLALILANVIYMSLKKQKYIVKSFIASVISPSIFGVLYLINVDVTLAIAASLALGMLMLFLIFNTLNNYVVIEMIEDRIIYWLKQIIYLLIFGIFALAAYLVFVLNYEFELGTITFAKLSDSIGRYILQLGVFIGAILCAIYSMFKKQDKPAPYYMGIFVLILGVIISPFTYVVYSKTSLNSLNTVAYLFLAVYIFVFLSEYIEKKKFIYKTLKVLMPLIIIFNLGYIIYSSFPPVQ